MPHKHTRKDNDASSFNLGPDAIAKPLPAYTKASLISKRNAGTQHKKKIVKVAGYGIDDTPRAFARLMSKQTGKRKLSGLDNGDTSRTKKAKTTKSTTVLEQPTESSAMDLPKLQPGERLADFSARVNQALPVAGLVKRRNVNVEGVKKQLSKREKRRHKHFAQWREEDAKIKAKEEELAEQAEEEQEELIAQYGEDVILPENKKARRKKMIGEIGSSNDDPWAVLKKKRQEPKGLRDVAQAPPDLKVIPKEKFKVRGGAKVGIANVPASAGSLKKREELGEARLEVIERYRAMMKANKDK